jgi:hypothetical protein
MIFCCKWNWLQLLIKASLNLTDREGRSTKIELGKKTLVVFTIIFHGIRYTSLLKNYGTGGFPYMQVFYLYICRYALLSLKVNNTVPSRYAT